MSSAGAAAARNARALAREASKAKKPAAAKQADAVATAVGSHVISADVAKKAIKKIQKKADLTVKIIAKRPKAPTGPIVPKRKMPKKPKAPASPVMPKRPKAPASPVMPKRPKAASKKPKAASKKPKAASKKPKAASKKPKAASKKPKAASKKPKHMSSSPKSWANMSLEERRMRRRVMNRHLLQTNHHSPKDLATYQKECEKFSVRGLRHWAGRNRFIIGAKATNKATVCSRLHSATHPSSLKRHSKKYRGQATGRSRSRHGVNTANWNSGSPAWRGLNESRNKSPVQFRRICNDLGKKSIVIYGRASKLPYKKSATKRVLCRSLSQDEK